MIMLLIMERAEIGNIANGTAERLRHGLKGHSVVHHPQQPEVLCTIQLGL